jgi:outer membrane protein assembly factor BamB
MLRALMPEGTERWKLQLGDIDGTAVLTEGLLLVGCADGHLYALALMVRALPTVWSTRTADLTTRSGS